MASEKLKNANDSNKHFTEIQVFPEIKLIAETGVHQNELVLDQSTFADITFDIFNGYSIKLIHQKAFGKSSQTIKDLEIWGNVNHSPPEYHVWNMFNSLINILHISIVLNITEIPSYAFDRLSNLRKLTIRSSNKLTIRNKAFYYLDNLTDLTIGFNGYQESKFNKIQNGAFAFEKPSNHKLNIMFVRCRFDGNSFEPGSFDGIQRPVQLKLLNSFITYLPETMRNSFLNHSNNTISFDNSGLNCSDCRNLWLFKDNPHQLKNVQCIEERSLTSSTVGNYNYKLTLFNFETELYFKSNCNLKYTPKNKSEINYYPCEYHSEKVRFKFKINY